MTTTLISNGGEGLPGCPKSWDHAHSWEDIANHNKEENCREPHWSFDCGYKLDFDGPIVSVSSRFYPPKTHYGPKWDGNVTVYILGDEVESRSFEAESLDGLKVEVEEYVSSIVKRISI